MKINRIQVKFRSELLEIIHNYLNKDTQLLDFYQYLIEVLVSRMLWKPDTLRHYNNWFFLSIPKMVEECRFDDQEIIEMLDKLEKLSLIKLKDTYFDSTIQLRIDLEMLQAIYKIQHEQGDLEEDY